MEKQTIAVLGPGSWGTALSQVLNDNGHEVRIWGKIFPNKSMKLIPIILTNTTLKDVVLKDSTDAFRLFSKPKDISTYEVVKGKLPSKQGEIALSSVYQDKYKIGDKISFSEKRVTMVRMS